MKKRLAVLPVKVKPEIAFTRWQNEVVDYSQSHISWAKAPEDWRTPGRYRANWTPAYFAKRPGVRRPSAAFAVRGTIAWIAISHNYSAIIRMRF